MPRTLEITTTHDEPQTLRLTTEDGDVLTKDRLQTAAASLLPAETEFSLRYTDSDGDRVTLTTDADVDELDKYMQSEQLHTLQVLVVPRQPQAAQRAATAVQSQLRGLVTAMSKLTAKPDEKPTPASAMSLLVASLQAMDVAEDAGELAAIKKELILVLQDEDFRRTVEELSATEEFKELADAMVVAIYKQDAQDIEDAATSRFDELLVFAQRVVERCPALKPVLMSVAKSLVTGLLRYNDQDVAGAASDSSSCSSSSSCCGDDQETVDVEVFAQEVPLHVGVICGGCEKAPLVGVRYKSLEVPNFDLCEDCEASGNYGHFEPFIKITDPSRAPKQKRTSERVHSYATCDGCEMSPIVGVRFKSDTKEDFDLCETCEASGKWTESHGPFTKMEEPGAMRALKFTCRRGGKFGHHGRFGHHHGHDHHGKYGRHHGKSGHRHGCHEKFGRHHHDSRHYHRGKFGHGGRHHGGHGKFGRHGHRHGPPDFADFAFHGPPFQGHDPRYFPAHPQPYNNGEVNTAHPRHDRPGFHGHGPPPEFDARQRHRGPPGGGPSGHFDHFGHFRPPSFGFPGPLGPPMCPRGFEHGRPSFPSPYGFHGHHGRHGRHTRFSEDDEDEWDEGRCHGRRHGCHGRGRWGDVTGDEETHEIRAADTDGSVEVVGAAATRAESANENATITETENKKDYSEPLMQLASMGFDDTEMNIRALELADGSVGGAVSVLLSE
ncbi:unnamed protein product [Phytophthora fragariaefolia]|uniref:Unnamed protein product n=1 Tax=Phytophthora fragariaefolia TaxID=1490495 RepID=A0A9W7D5Z3_9STRA|nr:unnamed protein product [Phytophthora fragariaefolia]